MSSRKPEAAPDKISVNLAIDAGNTRVKWGVFTGDRLTHHGEWTNWPVSDFIDLSTNQSVQKGILSSVRGDLPELSEYFQRHFTFLTLESNTPLPIRNCYATPETLGRDRIAAAAGAYALFPGRNCLVVDAGTCTTYEVITAGGDYLGGNISPGIDMRLKAMHHFTARLPLVNTGETAAWIGDSTETALQNGAQWGAILETEGYIRTLRRQMGTLTTILTGGNADFLAKKLKNRIFVHPYLVLIGLNKILAYNV